MKRFLLLLGILILPMPAVAAPVLTRDLVSAGGTDCSAGALRICGSLGGYAFGTSTRSGILVIEGFWFPGLLNGSAVEEPEQALALYPFRLDQNFPNPCRRQTSISYSVPGRGDAKVPVHIGIFDVQGRQIATLANASLAPGEYTTQWTGRDAAGHSVPAGVFYCRLQVGGTSAIKKLVVLK
jgi:hypothetical protein